MTKVSLVFGPLTGTELNDQKRELQSIIYPMRTREFDRIMLNDTLWQRVQTVYGQRDSLDLGEGSAEDAED